MTRFLATAVSWLCTTWLVLLPVGMVVLLINPDYLAEITRAAIRLPIQWYTIEQWQWFALWGLMCALLSIGYAAVFYLRRAFASFAAGKHFDPRNSRSLRRFATLLMAQGVTMPVFFAATSVLLSINHPAGQKLLSFSVGSDEIKLILSGLVMWVLADLLVEATQAVDENRGFV